MKFSPRNLVKLKNKNKKLKPNKFKRLKRETLRGQIKGTIERPRLSVYRSNENIYAQIIDDTNSKTLISCSTPPQSGRSIDQSEMPTRRLGVGLNQLGCLLI